MIKGGKGGGKTITGLNFETRVDLRTAFSKLPRYTTEDGKLYFNGELVARMFKKYDFYKVLLKDYKIDYASILSKRLLPDESMHVLSNDTVFIIEMKFQVVPGSVDEKLQTCDFKKKQYQKLLAGTKLKVEYVYILSEWFKNPVYKDVLEYIQSVGCYYFFETLPFAFLGLPEPVAIG